MCVILIYSLVLCFSKNLRIVGAPLQQSGFAIMSLGGMVGVHWLWWGVAGAPFHLLRILGTETNCFPSSCHSYCIMGILLY